MGLVASVAFPARLQWFGCGAILVGPGMAVVFRLARWGESDTRFKVVSRWGCVRRKESD